MLQIPAPNAPLPPDVSQVFVATGPPEWIAPVIVMALLVIGVVLFPLVRAWARSIDRKGVDPAILDEVHHLRERVSELESQSLRVQELEERLDFTERLLAQRENVVRLPREGGP